MPEDHAIPMDLTLEGELVVLRPSSEVDYSALQGIFSDPTTMQQLQYMAYIEEGGWTYEQMKDRYEKRRKGQADQQVIDFIIHDLKTDEVLGNCGFTTVDMFHKNAVYGMILHHPYWGKGVASECHLLCLEYAFEKLDLHRVEFGTFVTNIRMKKFFDSIGVSLEGIKKESFYENGQFLDDAIYALFEYQWPKVKENLQERREQQSK